MKTIGISNVKVYGLKSSVIRSKYPMAVPDKWSDNIFISNDRDEKRAINLGNVDQGEGHDCFLKGILVQADFKFPQYLWQQAKRYHWFDIISSQSTMHKILKLDINKNCNDATPYSSKRITQQLINLYNYAENNKDKYNSEVFKAKVEIFKKEEFIDVSTKDKLFRSIVSSIPSGLILTVGITTNYLQLKTIYNQRKHHKLIEWKEFCDWCLNLPKFKEYVCKEKNS